MVGCWRGYLSAAQGADLHIAQLMPLPLTVSCFIKIQIGFTFLVPAHPDKGPLNGCVFVCVCVSVSVCVYVCVGRKTLLGQSVVDCTFSAVLYFAGSSGTRTFSC